MICTPIIIDGPARGKSITVQGYQFRVMKHGPVYGMTRAFDDGSTMTDVTVEEILYHIHRFRIGNMSFAIASVKPQRPSDEKAFKKIFTAAAQRAVIRD